MTEDTIKDYADGIQTLITQLQRQGMSDDAILAITVATIRADEGIYRLMRMYEAGR